jgi:hypothetical protein
MKPWQINIHCANHEFIVERNPIIPQTSIPTHYVITIHGMGEKKVVFCERDELLAIIGALQAVIVP